MRFVALVLRASMFLSFSSGVRVALAAAFIQVAVLRAWADQEACSGPQIVPIAHDLMPHMDWLSRVEPLLLRNLTKLQAEFSNLHSGARLNQTSGFRATAYQAHLRSLRDVWAELHMASKIPQVCLERAQEVEREIKGHGIARCTQAISEARRREGKDGCLVGIPFVNRPGASTHERDPAEAIDLSRKHVGRLLSTNELDQLAAKFDLKRVAGDDQVHFTMTPERIDSGLLVARATVPLQLVGPDLRPVSPSHATDPEEGFGASFQPDFQEVQVFDIDRPLVGSYSLSADFPLGGTIEAYFVRFTEHGRLLDAREWQRSIFAGQSFSATFSVPDVADSSSPPIVMAPPPLRIPAASARGIQPYLSSRLTAWLYAASALDDGLEAPERQLPKIGELAVRPDSMFPVGRTTVRFFFTDASNNVGIAESTVVVFEGKRELRPESQSQRTSDSSAPLPVRDEPISNSNQSDRRETLTAKLSLLRWLGLLAVALLGFWAYRRRKTPA